MATHNIVLPSGENVKVLIKKGQERYLTQHFASVVKILQKLPPNTRKPVPLNFSCTVDSSVVGPTVADTSNNAPSVIPSNTSEIAPADPKPQPANPEPQPADTKPQASVEPPLLSAHPPPLSAQTPQPSAPQPGNAPHAVLTLWEDSQVKTLLRIITEKKDLLKVKNKKPVWKNFATELSKELGITVTGEQCYDKFRNMKQALRKHEDNKRKTGNGQQKPFKFPDMYEIIGDDPTLKPQFTYDSEGNTSGQVEEDLISDEESTSETPRKKLKSRNRSSLVANEMKDMFINSQKQLQETLITMHNENKELLAKLIDKL